MKLEGGKQTSEKPQQQPKLQKPKPNVTSAIALMGPALGQADCTSKVNGAYLSLKMQVS